MEIANVHPLTIASEKESAQFSRPLLEGTKRELQGLPSPERGKECTKGGPTSGTLTWPSFPTAIGKWEGKTVKIVSRAIRNQQREILHKEIQVGQSQENPNQNECGRSLNKE